MDQRTARDRLETGLYLLGKQERPFNRWRDYYNGDQDLPYAPEGVNEEVDELREMSIANWIKLVVRTAVQRLAVDNFRTHRGEELTAAEQNAADQWAWKRWQTNRLDGRQKMVYSDRYIYGRGIVSVWPAGGGRPAIVRPESPRRVWLQQSADDPFVTNWSVKSWSEHTVSRSPLADLRLRHAVVYDDDTFYRFRWGPDDRGWVLTKQDKNPLGEAPFVAFLNDPDTEGNSSSEVESMIRLQDSINTTRFYLMLAMGFAAFRQRGIIGYDPVQRDEHGNAILDEQGNPKITPPPRAGVDRTWVFPGADTKIFEFSESNLENYIKSQSSHVQHTAALTQTPPHYLLGQLSNLSAEALTAAEATLNRKIIDAQTTDGEAWEDVQRRATIAEGGTAGDWESQTVWRNTETVSIGQIVDAITKLVGGEPVLPPEAAREMIPGATGQDLRRWKQMAQDRENGTAARIASGDLADALAAVKAPIPQG
ncbi:phage portal protein [Saccharopolyspora sp. NPDC003752]